MHALLAFKVLLPVIFAVVYVVSLFGYPDTVATAAVLAAATLIMTIAVWFSATASPSLRMTLPAAIAATSAGWAGFIASTPTKAYMLTNSDVMMFFASFVAAALGVAILETIETKRGPKISLALLLVHNVLWTGAIGAAVYFSATLSGVVAIVVAIGLPIALLKYETRPRQQFDPAIR